MDSVGNSFGGIFFVNNVFVYDTLEKTIEYNSDIENAREKATEELNKWEEKAAANMVPHNNSSLFGNRVKINYYDSYGYLTIDGINIIIDFKYFEYNNTDYLYEIKTDLLVSLLNNIAVYGVEEFLINYKKKFLESYPEIVKNLNELTDLYKEKGNSITNLKKNSISLESIKLQLSIWEPIGKTNEEMEEIISKLHNM